MPFKSEAQRRKFHAMVSRGEISEKKVQEWEHETPKNKKLPEHVKKSSAELIDELRAKLGMTSNFTTGMPTEKPFASQITQSHTPQGNQFGSGAGGGGAGGPKTAAVDPEAIETAAEKITASPAGSKVWQGLTGLSDDVLIVGARIREKNERARAKHAAQQLASSVSMLEKMSDLVQGGKADGKPASKYDPHEMAMGKKVEQEHTSNPQLAEEIAKDHLEEIPDYYSRLKRMEDAAPKKEAGLLQERPMQGSFPNMISAPLPPDQQLPPDIFQLLKSQALIDQSKMAQINDPGDGPHLPYPSQREDAGAYDQQLQQQAMYAQMAAEQQRAQHVENTYKDKVRRGELIGGVGGMVGGGLLGHLVSSGSKYHLPATMLSAAGVGLLGKGYGRHVGQQQGLEYLQEYSGVPWAVK